MLTNKRSLAVVIENTLENAQQNANISKALDNIINSANHTYDEYVLTTFRLAHGDNGMFKIMTRPMEFLSDENKL